MLNRCILTSICILLLCMMIGCSNTDVNLGESSNGNTYDTSTTTDMSENTTVTTVTTIEDTTQTSLAPDVYKTMVENTIVDYESMLMQLNQVIQNYTTDDTWNEQLQSCLDTSSQYLNTLTLLQDSGAVPKKYSKSHERLIYCMNHYTESIKLIQQSIECYLQDDITDGDDYMNQALNRSQLANKVWSQIRGYGIVEYTGETLEPQVVYSQAEVAVISDENGNETFVLQTTEPTTPQTTYQKYNDGYAFGNDNVFIYSD